MGTIYETEDGQKFSDESSAQRHANYLGERNSRLREERERRSQKWVAEMSKPIKEVQELAVKAQEYHNADNNELEAKTLYKLLVSLTEPKWNNYVEKFRNEGGSYRRGEASNDVFAQYNKCIPMYCINAQLAYINWASQLAQKNDLEGAISACSEAIEFGGKHFGASYARRGIYNYKIGKKLQGINDLKKGADYGDEEAIETLKSIEIFYTPKNLPLPPPKFTPQ